MSVQTTRGQLRQLLRRGPSWRARRAVRQSRAVEESARYVIQALRNGTAPAGRYRLRESGLSMRMRHRAGDACTLEEIFLSRSCALPKPVERTLAGARPLAVADLGAKVGL